MLLKLINILFVLFIRHQLMERHISVRSMSRVLVTDETFFPAVVSGGSWGV